MLLASFDDAARAVREVAPDAEVTALSRGPLGDGSVTGFTVAPADRPPFTAYVDDSRIAVQTETGAVREDGVRVWEHPADPHLPALLAVAYRGAIADLLGRTGVAVSAPPEIVAYRPGRRAVLRVPTDAGIFWAKVVPPDRAERIVERHAGARRGGLPVPPVRCWSPHGLLLLDSAVGTAATEGRWNPSDLAASVDDLRARLAASPLRIRTGAGIEARSDWYRRRLSAALPERAETLALVAAAVAASTPGDASGVVHGDLHIGQLFLDDAGAVSGLIDLDTAGVGEPAQDAAAFLGHAIASAALTPHPASTDQLLELAVAIGSHDASPRVHALTAVHLLGHAVSTFEAGRPSIADALVTAAHRILATDGLSKNVLIDGFETV